MSTTYDTGVARRIAKARTGVHTTLAILVGGGTAAWVALVGAYAVWRHQQFLSHRFDLGNMVQAVWSSARGRPLEFTDAATGEQLVRLAAHVDPILLLLTPVWVIYPEPATLLVVQTLALASGIYPVIRLALKYVGNQVAAVLLGAWYLTFPWLIWNALNDFHPATLAIPLLLYGIWFLDQHRLVPFALVAGLALLTGELIGLTIGALGVWYWLRHGRRRAGSAIALAGFGWTAFCLAVVVPAFNDGATSRFNDRFETVGGSPRGLLSTLFTDPGTIAEAATTTADLRYVTLLLVPTALLALGSPLLLLVAVPQLSLNLLSDFWSTTQPMFQYVAPIVPALVAATVMTVGRFPDRARTFLAATLLLSAIVVLIAVPPAPGGHAFVFGARESEPRLAAMRAAVSLVPSDAPVTATNRLGAHLSERATIHLFPNTRRAEWAVLDTRDPWLEVAGEKEDAPRFERLLGVFEGDPSWELLFDQEGVRVYRRQT